MWNVKINLLCKAEGDEVRYINIEMLSVMEGWY